MTERSGNEECRTASALGLGAGIQCWREKITPAEQGALVSEIFALTIHAPFYRPTMPRTDRPFSVEETNLGPLGWFSDKDGYRYRNTHPYTEEQWPPIPAA